MSNRVRDQLQRKIALDPDFKARITYGTCPKWHMSMLSATVRYAFTPGH